MFSVTFKNITLDITKVFVVKAKNRSGAINKAYKQLKWHLNPFLYDYVVESVVEH